MYHSLFIRLERILNCVHPCYRQIVQLSRISLLSLLPDCGLLGSRRVGVLHFYVCAPAIILSRIWKVALDMKLMRVISHRVSSRVVERIQRKYNTHITELLRGRELWLCLIRFRKASSIIVCTRFSFSVFSSWSLPVPAPPPRIFGPPFGIPIGL